MVSPAHYQGNDVVKEQPIEIMYRSMTQEAFEGYCIGNVMKYICRFRAKNGDEDLDKAKTYIEFLRCSFHGESPLFAVMGDEKK